MNTKIFLYKNLLVLLFVFLCSPLGAMSSDEDEQALQEGFSMFEPENSGENCVICLDPIDIGGLSLEPCNHAFHQACIYQSLSQTDARCPLCRTKPTNIPLIDRWEHNLAQQRRNAQIDEVLTIFASHINQILARDGWAQLAAHARRARANQPRRSSDRYFPLPDNAPHIYDHVPPEPEPATISRTKKISKITIAFILGIAVCIYAYADSISEYFFGSEEPSDEVDITQLSPEEFIAHMQKLSKDGHNENNKIPNQSGG